MKSKEEILDFNYDSCFNCNVMHPISKTHILDSMEEYADQFKPKWIPIYPLHDIDSGRIFILDKSGYIRSDRVIGIITSNLLEGNGLTPTHYCKIVLPENPEL